MQWFSIKMCINVSCEDYPETILDLKYSEKNFTIKMHWK